MGEEFVLCTRSSLINKHSVDFRVVELPVPVRVGFRKVYGINGLEVSVKVQDALDTMFLQIPLETIVELCESKKKYFELFKLLAPVSKGHVRPVHQCMSVKEADDFCGYLVSHICVDGLDDHSGRQRQLTLTLNTRDILSVTRMAGERVKYFPPASESELEEEVEETYSQNQEPVTETDRLWEVLDGDQENVLTLPPWDPIDDAQGV
jgi:hypothetical protein